MPGKGLCWARPGPPFLKDLMPNSPKASALKRLQAEAEASHEGFAAQPVLERALAGLSRTRVQGLIKQGRVSPGGATIVTRIRVKPGERFLLDLPPTAPAEPLPEACRSTSCTRTKPDRDRQAGRARRPSGRRPRSRHARQRALALRHEPPGIGGVARPGMVHRLDKDTSGLIVVAKTTAHRTLAEQFADPAGRANSSAAILRWSGGPRPARMRIDAAIGRDRDPEQDGRAAAGRAARP